MDGLASSHWRAIRTIIWASRLFSDHTGGFEHCHIRRTDVVRNRIVPTGRGPVSSTVTIPNNDAAKNPYTFTIAWNRCADVFYTLMAALIMIERTQLNRLATVVI